MPTLNQIKTTVNSRLADFFPKFQVKQEAYRANPAHRGYWQGIAFSSVPDDGATVAPNYSACPADHPGEDWSSLSASSDLPAGVEAQLICDVYEKPTGVFGYFLTARVSKGGTTYRRTAQVEMGTVLDNGSWIAEV